jgi:GNAT superfamily N-acetyltransferase
VNRLLQICTSYQRHNGNFTVRSGLEAVDLDTVHEFLKTTPWAADLSRAALARAIRHSLCFSLFEENRQIGFARVITDYVTYAYMCDVYVVEAQRRRGLGSWLIRCVLEHPDIASLKRIALITHDAQGFYSLLGFESASRPDNYMERILRPEKG